MRPSLARRVWTLRSFLYGLCESSDARRWRVKDRLFNRAHGRTLLIAAGTGLDFRHLPAVRVTAIEFSAAMLAKARQRVTDSRARLDLVQADAQSLPFPTHAFDTIITSFTLCSVPDPVAALAEIRRTLKPRGRLLMFEHVRSRQRLLGWVLDVMNLWTRVGGARMNQQTVRRAIESGFRIVGIESVFLDVIIAVEAIAPSRGGPGAPSRAM